MLSLAFIYFLSRAEFLGITQILIYAGGILILLVFGIMLTQTDKIRQPSTEVYQSKRGVILGLGIFATVYYLILGWETPQVFQQSESANTGSFREFGVSLLTDYVLLFEVAGILLLICIAGVVLLVSTRIKKYSNGTD
jgi:NADH-quinone oxidoreductase subunit J